jgi:hypothetical protein
MIDNETQEATARSARRWGAGAALVAAGLAGGVILAGTMTANAATSTPTPAASSSSSSASGTSGSSTNGTAKTVDPSQPQRSDEKLLTGDTATKVTSAALAKYPGATIERVETDSDGVYEAHIVTTAGDHVIVQVGADFAVTAAGAAGLRTGHGGGKGGPMNGVDPDPNDNDGPGTSNPADSQSGSSSATPSATTTS